MIEKQFLANAQDKYQAYKQQDEILCNSIEDISPSDKLELAYEALEQRYQSDYAELHIEEMASEYSWYAEAKSKSRLVGCALLYGDMWKLLKITLDNIATTVCTILHSCNKEQWIHIPERLVLYRNQLSLAKVHFIIEFLSKYGFCETKIIDGKLYIKLNRHALLEDPFIQIKMEKTEDADREARRYIINNFNRDELYPHTKRYKLKHRKETILGVIYWYNTLLHNELNSKERINAENLYGSRLDVAYMEHPSHLTSIILNMHELEVRASLRHIARGADYIAKHTEQYTPNTDIHNYFNKEYQTQNNLENYMVAEYDDHHPIITDNSYIIFREKFENTKLFKEEIYPNKNKYLRMIKAAIKYLKETNGYDNINVQLPENRNIKTIEERLLADNSTKYELQEILYNDKMSRIDVELQAVKGKNARSGIRFNLTPDEISNISSIKDLFKQIKKLLSKMGFDSYNKSARYKYESIEEEERHCRQDDFTHYIEQFQALINRGIQITNNIGFHYRVVSPLDYYLRNLITSPAF